MAMEPDLAHSSVFDVLNILELVLLRGHVTCHATFSGKKAII